MTIAGVRILVLPVGIVLGMLPGACCSQLFAADAVDPAAAAGAADPALPESSRLLVRPPEVQLDGSFARAQLLVTRTGASGNVDDRSEDVTGRAAFTSSDPSVVRADEGGRLLAVGNGEATITVCDGDRETSAAVMVAGLLPEPEVRYRDHVAPVLSKAGCNMGSCHASQHGQGGFKLSVFGFDPDEDHDSIVRDRQQRRVNFLDPPESLILKKPTMQIPHGGSRRLEPGSVDYQIVLTWLAAGAPAPSGEAVPLKHLAVTPPRRVGQVGLTQQVRVEAVYADGRRRDVTALAKFDSMDDAVLEVTPDGMVTTVGPGQAPLMVRFEGEAVISMFVVPLTENVDLSGWESQNFVDELAVDRFHELGIEPSPLCDDATFLRRAYFDAVGTLPGVEQTREFLASDEPDKRTRLVHRLLSLSETSGPGEFDGAYASYWTLKWSDLIRNSSRELGEQGMWALHNWIRESLRTNKPIDAFVRELITAQGSIYSNGPANYFRINRTADDLAESTAQLFLGVRLQCAKCHHHPFENYSQADYYRFASFFSRVGTKSSEEFGIFGRESVVVVRSSGEVKHPRTGEVMKPTPLGGEVCDHPLDRRIVLAEWLTSPDNEFFARSIVNRYVGYLLGRGLVEPIDDMRATNPPSNVALMDRLAEEFVQSGYDVKKLMGMIMSSRLYQLDSQPTPANESDSRFYSHFKVKRLSAEALLDAVDAATLVPTKFKALPLGTRAIDLPDAEYPNYFLTTFGKPRRASVCECERVPDESLSQALHTLNGDTLAAKIAHKNGRVAKLLEENRSHDEIVEELYLSALCRLPTEDERAACRQFLDEAAEPRQVYEDLQWALLNSKHFLFVR